MPTRGDGLPENIQEPDGPDTITGAGGNETTVGRAGDDLPDGGSHSTSTRSRRVSAATPSTSHRGRTAGSSASARASRLPTCGCSARPRPAGPRRRGRRQQHRVVGAVIVPDQFRTRLRYDKLRPSFLRPPRIGRKNRRKLPSAACRPCGFPHPRAVFPRSVRQCSRKVDGETLVEEVDRGAVPSIAAASVRSPGIGTIVPRLAPVSPASVAPASAERAVTATVKPRRARFSATARPMPERAPVTRAAPPAGVAGPSFPAVVLPSPCAAGRPVPTPSAAPHPCRAPVRRRFAGPPSGADEIVSCPSGPAGRSCARRPSPAAGPPARATGGPLPWTEGSF